MTRRSLRRRIMEDRKEEAKRRLEKEQHDKYHVNGPKVLQCRCCRANWIDYGKMKRSV